MKILYVANIRFPTEKAHGIAVAKMCESFVRAGVEVELIIPSRGKGKDPFEFYGLTERFKVTTVYAPGFISTYLGFILSSLIFGLTSYLYLRKKEGIIYSMDIDPISYVFLPFLKRSYFFDIHGPKRHTYPTDKMFKSISGVVTINENVKSELVNNFPNLEEKIMVFPNGTDVKEDIGKEKARQRLNLPKDQKIAVYTGGFIGWKGIETIIESAKSLDDIHFYFVGISEIDFKEREVELSGNIHALGRKSHTDAKLFQSASDVLIVTGTKHDKYSYHHTSPMKLFEYMSARRPIVASKTPAIELVVDESKVFFHEPDDIDSFEEAVRSAFEEDASKKIQNAFEYAKEISWDNRAKKVISFIKERI